MPYEDTTSVRRPATSQDILHGFNVTIATYISILIYRKQYFHQALARLYEQAYQKLDKGVRRYSKTRYWHKDGVRVES